jgi:hypothetical protein
LAEEPARIHAAVVGGGTGCAVFPALVLNTWVASISVHAELMAT